MDAVLWVVPCWTLLMQRGRLIDAGRTSDVYAFGDDAVVKVPKADVPRHWAGVEFALGDVVHRQGLPAPAARGIVVLDERPCVVFDRVDGPTMWQLMLDDNDRVEELAHQLVELQHRIHCVGIPEGVPDLVGRTIAKVEAMASSSPDFDELVAEVSAIPRGAALLHGDLHPANVLFGADGPVVIDWFDAAVGHPIADFARSSILMRPRMDPARCTHLPGAESGLLEALHAAYSAAWRAIVGDPGALFERWRAIVAFARISEGADAHPEQLLDIWRRRPQLVS